MKVGFIIFAHERSGSNSLANLLSCHPRINIIYEPFNEPWQLESNPPLVKKIKNIKDVGSLDKFLEEINKTHQGIKHLFYQVDKKYNQHLLKKSSKIIFLTRKNLLKTIISKEISMRIGIWDTWKRDKEQVNKIILNHKFDSFSVEKVKKQTIDLKEEIKGYKDYLKKKNIPFLEITYEELYDSNIFINDKINKINNILKFLGYSPIKDIEKIKKMKGLLDYKKRKINNIETYTSIPNILEIEKRLGNKETGYLFDEPKDSIKKLKIQIKIIKGRLNS